MIAEQDGIVLLVLHARRGLSSSAVCVFQTWAPRYTVYCLGGESGKWP